MPSEALLAVEGVSKRFGGLVANQDVTLHLMPEEIRGLIGPNGAGKTTLVNLISGEERPDRGDVRLAGRSLLGVPPFRRARWGLLRTFQVPRLFGSMTVRENLLLPYLALGGRDGREARRRGDELLERSGLAHLAGEPARHLSGGQQALLQLIAGFICDHLCCYLLDEPFAGVNPVIKETMIDLVRQHNRQRGTVFLIVSHEMPVIRELCARVTVLAAGRVLFEGSMDEAARTPEVVDAYLGKAWAP
ncbi:MAG TPA: ABC transporter ATP-binding protein [Candidatus Dormibacteraeota bacterium]|nr:ABC transporter ATP-binding protein [Candidatus Dormibacteraeota bacterium]